MGMDVYGVSPRNGSGKYFRANIWSWRPIYAAMYESGCMDVVGEETFNLMASNDGRGATTAEQCEKIAIRLEQFVEGIDGDVYSPESLDHPSFQVSLDGQFVDEDYEGETRSPYYTSKEHLEEFITFLRNCGEGFEVW